MVVTIKDIARKAGVAHTTVSRALRGSPLISTATTEKIQKIASEMGYHPSAAARSLKTRRSHVLGVIVSAIDDPFFSEILQGIDDVAQQNDYSLFIAASQRDLNHERAIVRTMREHRVDGVILCSTPFSVEQSKQLNSSDIPIVVINNQSAQEYSYSIYHDDLDGSCQVVRHLVDLGHRHIAYLGYAHSGRTNARRLAGYRQQMKAAGCEIHPGYEYLAQITDPASGFSAVSHFIHLSPRPTAIFCYNDMLAVGVLRGLQDIGLKVPGDMSVAGFDNITFSAFTNPPLTTFDQPKRLIGTEAASLLLSLLTSDGSGPRIKMMQGCLLERKSTAKLS